MEFLTASNRKGLGDKVKLFDDGTLNAEGKDVVVIGGGRHSDGLCKNLSKTKSKISKMFIQKR